MLANGAPSAAPSCPSPTLYPTLFPTGVPAPFPTGASGVCPIRFFAPFIGYE